MDTLVKRYPVEFTDEELREALTEIAEEVRLTSGTGKCLSLEQQTSRFMIGHAEMQRRNLDESARQSAKMTMWALGIAGLSLVVSLASLYVTWHSSH